MSITPDRFIQCMSDGYIAVRTREGDLLGCIPGTPPQEDFINSPIGALSVWAGIVYTVIPTEEQLRRLRELPGFVASDEGSLDLARPLAANSGNDDQADIGQPI